MKIQVMYHSLTGNTKKVAEAIALTAGVSAEAMMKNSRLSEPIDLLFIGDGIYAGRMNSKTRKFIEKLDGSLVKNAVVFGTYGGLDTAIIAMTELLKARGISVCADRFSCKGQSWFFANRQHPNKEDMELVHAFAARMIESVKSRCGVQQAMD